MRLPNLAPASLVATGLIALLAIGGATVASGKPAPAPPPPPFTAAQAAEGAKAYAVSCAMCHGKDLAGTVEIPTLTGRFVGNWAGRPLGDLTAYLARAMPQFAPGSLSPEDTARITAYLLSANGYAAGAKVLPTTGPALAAVLPAPPRRAAGAGAAAGGLTAADSPRRAVR
jgi:mono/diheme cytochrome c family protein